MKLRNKKTGEIAEVKSVKFYCEGENGQRYEWSQRKYSGGITLAELNEEWEDYEEPKEKYNYYYLDCDGEICCYCDTLEETKGYREIGNYFGTEEEAEKAVEKLKAWKRLKQGGFHWNSWTLGGAHFGVDLYDGYNNDLDLVFGGEE